MGKLLVVVGLVIAGIGLLVMLGAADRPPAGRHRLSGAATSTFYFPLVTCIVVSIMLTLVLSFLRR